MVQLSIAEVLSDDVLKYRTYIFYFFTALVHTMTVIEPLIKLLFYKLKSKEQKVKYIYIIYIYNIH